MRRNKYKNVKHDWNHGTKYVPVDHRTVTSCHMWTRQGKVWRLLAIHPDGLYIAQIVDTLRIKRTLIQSALNSMLGHGVKTTEGLWFALGVSAEWSKLLK